MPACLAEGAHAIGDTVLDRGMSVKAEHQVVGFEVEVSERMMWLFESYVLRLMWHHISHD
jgi:hypothetical protein